jgi:tripartite-type tricarboxylate transporter receptor subunit TctC
LSAFPRAVQPTSTRESSRNGSPSVSGQQFLVENRPGAASNIGTEAALRSPPDGYTLLQVTSSNAVNATFYDNLPFNILADTEPAERSFACRS